MKNKFTNFLSCFYANTPQNTGGGNSHSSTVVTPIWKGSRPTVSRRSTDSQSQDHRNHTPISKALKYAAMILMILTLGIGNVWGDTYADTYTNPASGSGLAGNANGKGAFSAITCGTGTSFGNSSLQIGTNGGSGTFTVASIDGSYITSIAFTSQSSYPINTLTSEQGTITIDGDVYTFTPNSATLTSATFSMSANSGKKVRVAPITVNLTSDHSYLSMNFGVSSGKVSCTKSSGAADLAVTTTGSASSNRLSFGSGKTLTFTSEDHNISSINFTFVNHAAGSGITASTGTFAGTSWTPDEDVKTVTFSSTSSNTIGAISVKLAAAAACTAPTITTDLSTTQVEYNKGATATPLGIVATGDNLTYQWYSNTSNTTEGGTSLGSTARSASYTPSTAAAGTKYYYCIVSSGTCSTTSAITPIKVNAVRTAGWVIFDGMTDGSFAAGSIKYNDVTVSYSVAGNTMLGADDVAKRNKNNDFSDEYIPNAVKVEKNDGSSTGYVSFTIPAGYEMSELILACAYLPLRLRIMPMLLHL